MRSRLNACSGRVRGILSIDDAPELLRAFDQS